mgnify:CR=1 FL=1|tara:strand:+ start:12790 stop:13191 length:402 start_codon:yes stop_codon:yes gene_type:complete
MSGVRKLVTGSFLLLFIGAMFSGFFHMTMTMDMVDDASGCAFMSSGKELCNMSVAEHISTWQSTFLATMPVFNLLLLALAAAVIIFTVAPNLLLKQRFRVSIIPKEIVERVYTFSYRPLQELFSSGILHPKLF